MTSIFVRCKKGTIRPYLSNNEKIYIETRTIEFTNRTGHKAHVCKNINQKTDYLNNYAYSNMRVLNGDKITKIRFDIGKNMIQHIRDDILKIMVNNVIPAVKYHDFSLQISSSSITSFKISYDVYKIYNSINCTLIWKISKNIETNEVFSICFDKMVYSSYRVFE